MGANERKRDLKGGIIVGYIALNPSRFLACKWVTFRWGVQAKVLHPCPLLSFLYPPSFST